MLHEAQEELKNLRNKTMPNTTSRRYHSLGLFPMVSARLPPGHPPPTLRLAGAPGRRAGLELSLYGWLASPFYSLDLDPN